MRTRMTSQSSSQKASLSSPRRALPRRRRSPGKQRMFPLLLFPLPIHPLLPQLLHRLLPGTPLCPRSTPAIILPTPSTTLIALLRHRRRSEVPRHLHALPRHAVPHPVLLVLRPHRPRRLLLLPLLVPPRSVFSRRFSLGFLVIGCGDEGGEALEAVEEVDVTGLRGWRWRWRWICGSGSGEGGGGGGGRGGAAAGVAEAVEADLGVAAVGLFAAELFLAGGGAKNPNPSPPPNRHQGGGAPPLPRVMKISVKTLKGSKFEIEAKPEDTVADVKKIIESTQGQNVYPAEQQMLIYQGKVLNDDNATLNDNKISENTFLVVMLKKATGSSSGASTAKTTSSSKAPASSSVPADPPTPTPAPAAPTTTLTNAPATIPTPSFTLVPSSAVVPVAEGDVYGQAASNLVAGSNLEGTVQQILDMGGGTWDRDTVIRALRAAYNNPERAIEYLYSGIPVQAEAPAPTAGQPVNPPVQVPELAQPAVPSTGPNANPLDLFPQGLPSIGSDAGAGSLDFLRNSSQFRALQSMVQANPQILQPMLQELAKQNPQVMRLIQDHQSEFLRLVNEPAEGADSNLLGQLGDAMPQSVTVTPEESEAIERLEAMGFDRALVLEVFFACNRDEELAANYLLDHMHEFEE